MTESAHHLVVLCTCPDSDSAESIASDLVTRRIAACVNVLSGVRSYFYWDGEQQTADEVLLLIKTVRSRFTELSERISVLHSYDVPEIIALDVKDGLPAYLRWIDVNTA